MTIEYNPTRSAEVLHSLDLVMIVACGVCVLKMGVASFSPTQQLFGVQTNQSWVSFW